MPAHWHAQTWRRDDVLTARSQSGSSSFTLHFGIDFAIGQIDQSKAPTVHARTILHTMTCIYFHSVYFAVGLRLWFSSLPSLDLL